MPERLAQVFEEPLGIRVQEERRLIAGPDAGRLDLRLVDGARTQLEVLEDLVGDGELDRPGELESVAADQLGRRGHATDEVVLLQAEHPHAAPGHDGGGGQAVVPGSDDDDVVVRHRHGTVVTGSVACRNCLRECKFLVHQGGDSGPRQPDCSPTESSDVRKGFALGPGDLTLAAGLLGEFDPPCVETRQRPDTLRPCRRIRNSSGGIRSCRRSRAPWATPRPVGWHWLVRPASARARSPGAPPNWLASSVCRPRWSAPPRAHPTCPSLRCRRCSRCWRSRSRVSGRFFAP